MTSATERTSGVARSDSTAGAAHAAPVAAGVPGHPSGQSAGVFLFFSNRLGCFGSLLVSAALTLVLLLLLNVI